MKVMIFGATGFVGKHLIAALQQKGHAVSQADIRKGDGWQQELGEADAVINLAGSPIFGKRWTTKIKAEIYDSRVEGTKKITDAMYSVHQKTGKPKVFLNASAVGYYGADTEMTFDESSPPGPDFLAFVCRDWEESARRAAVHDKIRTVIVRFGIILGPDGGALQKLVPPFKMFAGGPIGFGKQWMSWVHVDDVVGILLYAIENESVQGVLNGTSPHPVRNKEFSTILGKVLHRPAIFPLPGFVLRIMIGEGAEFLITGQRVLPKKTEEVGYKFKFPELEPALKNILG